MAVLNNSLKEVFARSIAAMQATGNAHFLNQIVIGRRSSGKTVAAERYAHELKEKSLVKGDVVSISLQHDVMTADGKEIASHFEKAAGGVLVINDAQLLAQSTDKTRIFMTCLAKALDHNNTVVVFTGSDETIPALNKWPGIKERLIAQVSRTDHTIRLKDRLRFKT